MNNRFLYTFSFKHNLQEIIEMFPKKRQIFPLVGELHHYIFYKQLEFLNKNIAQQVYATKNHKNLTAYITKKHLYLYTTNSIIGNTLIDNIEKNQQLTNTIQISNNLLQKTVFNNINTTNNNQSLTHTKLVLQSNDIKLSSLNNITKSLISNNNTINIKIRTPLLISPRFHMNVIYYLITTSYRKVYNQYFDFFEKISFKLSSPSTIINNMPVYNLNFLQLKQKLFSPSGKQSYTGIYGNISIKFKNPMWKLILKLASLTNLGLKASYGYGHTNIISSR